ncbi:MAG: Rieske 2Fe-2S domain-containing protein [Herbaspirillum sp.]
MDRIFVCTSDALIDGGKGIRFPVTAGGEPLIAFAVRYRQLVHAYLNRCAHVAMELDWNEGEFFSAERDYLICSVHGAIYAPDTGVCAGGPCRGGRLYSIALIEEGGQVFWQPDNYVGPAIA